MSVNFLSFANDLVPQKPFFDAKEKLMNRINGAITKILLDEPFNTGERYEDTIIIIPELLATKPFVEEISNYVRSQFAVHNIGTSHLCVSKDAREIHFHSETLRPRPDSFRAEKTPEGIIPASRCKNERL